jgi:hypothetical protein
LPPFPRCCVSWMRSNSDRAAVGHQP